MGRWIQPWFPRDGMGRGKDMAPGSLSLPFSPLYPHQVTHVFCSGQNRSLCHPWSVRRGCALFLSEEGVCFELRRQLTVQTWLPETITKSPCAKGEGVTWKGRPTICREFQNTGAHEASGLQPATCQIRCFVGQRILSTAHSQRLF